MRRLIGIIVVGAIVIILIFIGLAQYHSMGFGRLKSVETLISEGKLEEAKSRLDEIAIKQKNPSLAIGKAYISLAKAFEEKNEYLQARDIYNLIFNNYQNLNDISGVQDAIGRLNVKLLFSPTVTERDILYKVEPGDTLSKIANKFGTTVDLIKLSNKLKDDTIHPGDRLKVSKARYKVLIDKSQNILTVLFDDNTIFKVYRVSTGENNCTPQGTFKIINKIKDPVWYTEGAIVPAESPKNILGSRWLGLSIKGYGIHGTIEPETVGKQATKGCIRMLNSDVEELFTILPIGTEVTIVE